MKDNETLLVKMLPKNRPALIDSNKDVPKGPTVSTSDGSKSQNRTYQDLLKNKTDEANFDVLVTSELYKVSLSEMQLYLKLLTFMQGKFSPDGNYLMLTTIQNHIRILSHKSRFPQKQRFTMQMEKK